MNNERLRNIEELFHTALEKEPQERAAFLDRACADSLVRGEIDELIRHHEDPGSFLRCSSFMAFDTQSRLETNPHDRGDEGGLSRSVSRIGRYRVIKRIAEGGMGVVYEAEQEQPRRTVAVKVIKSGLATPALLHRFELEAEALGRLQHPGIAQIYEAGTADIGFGPQPYFAMELIRGRSPREYAEEHHLNTRERLEMVAKIADAVQHAHQRGIIHRDLKPANILIDETGQPKILDFGLARATDNAMRATGQTAVGELVGTLAYMSPEQVLADPMELDTRTDVYSLGVVLYELLTGRLPYTVGNKIHDALEAIRQEDPALLSSIDRIYRGDIETITAKALEKDKTRRYASASEMAADIRRHLNDEPIVARPPSPAYQLKKFARRHKGLVIGVAAVFIVLIGGIVASTVEETRARRALGRAIAAEETATKERGIAVAALTRAMVLEKGAREERDKALAEQRRADGEAAMARTQRLITIWESLAHESIRESEAGLDYDRAALLAVQALHFNTRTSDQPRNLIEQALQQAAHLDPPIHTMLPDYRTSLYSVAVSPDGALIAAGGGEKNVRVWTLKNPGAPPLLLPTRVPETIAVGSVAFSHDGKRLAVGAKGVGGTTGGSIQVWDLQNPNRPPLVIEGGGSIESLAFSPDDLSLASGAGTWASALKNSAGLVLWDIGKANSAHVLSRIHSATNCPPLACIEANSINSVSFSPDGSRLASASGEAVELWEIKNPGRPAVSLRPGPLSAVAGTPPEKAQNAVLSVAFSPDGTHLAAAGFHGIQIWDLRDLQAPPVSLIMPVSRPQRVKSLTYSPDGAHLAATNGALWIWDLRSPSAPPKSSLKTSNAIAAVTYFPHDDRLAGVSPTGLQIWDLGHGSNETVDSAVTADAAPNQAPLFLDEWSYSEDLSRLVEGSGKTLKLWDLRQHDALPAPLEGHPAPASASLGPRHVSSLAFSPDGMHVAAASAVSTGIRLSIWDVQKPGARPRLEVNIPDSPLPFSRVVFSPDGAHLAATGSTIHIVDMRAPNAPPGSLGSSTVFRTVAGAIAFSPDGHRLAVGRFEPNVHVEVWDLRRPAASPLLLPMPTAASVSTVKFSPDGGRLAATGIGGRTVVWDLRNPAAPPKEFEGARVLAFSKDSARLATDSGAFGRIFDLQAPGVPALELPRPAGYPGVILALAFSPDGTSLTIGTSQRRTRTLRFWSAAAEDLCARTWRNFSMEEWRHYVGEGIPYERTCPALPPGTGVLQ